MTHSADDSQKETERRSHNARLGYHKLKLGDNLDDSGVITLPAGQIKLAIDDIFGRPSQEVLRAIGEQPESSGTQVWLRAAVGRESEGWFGRLLGRSWSDSAPNFEKQVDLASGKLQTIKIGSGM